MSSKEDVLKSPPPGPQNVALFGHRIFTEVTKLKRGHQGGPYPNMTGVFTKRGSRTRRPMCTEGDNVKTLGVENGTT